MLLNEANKSVLMSGIFDNLNQTHRQNLILIGNVHDQFSRSKIVKRFRDNDNKNIKKMVQQTSKFITFERI